MGVFARLLGRSKPKPEAPAAVARTGDGPGEAAAPEAVEVVAETADAADSSGDGHEDAAAGAQAAGARGAEGGEGADIPKQQSADEVADSEAGEGARR
ncbi:MULTISPECIES: hypothetical protein [unclassified Streptomyces]|uniref:hypothetical protein n=1 Tax=unclassified Streptomyces TaxID=2593676 RepID=UPI00369DF0CB